ncbi:HAD-IA family hydrolase [Argonema antarcticum]|uniref:HAD-IA family hydrolase n=1 Tax=Argonema antarcticum TaxID=2942763 RepID=UPI0020130D96|nr:HAD-IA family hydrolase [Argonema antarcticum]MCL1473526.1 HAD-IA family hydrolase [Argonema antarcticum A004/B2]
MQQPKVIFLDAVGTLFGVRGSVGEIYREIALRFGIEVSAKALDRVFYNSFKSSSRMAFPGVERQEIPNKEFEWWSAIAIQTFQEAGAFHQFADFSSFFAELYAYFAKANPWFIYPDVLPALEYWRKQGIELGIVSNFDSRIYSVLSDLHLAKFFTSITISTEVGAAKPESEIFVKGLHKHDCLAEAAWHIGDSFKEDYQGAKAAGLRAIWLKRSEPFL